MGAFNILKRFRSSEPAKATAPSAETLTADKTATGINVAARTSQKKSKRLHKTAGAAGVAGALAGTSSAQDGVAPASNKLPEVAPRVDLSILREPSPPLVDVSFDGHRASSPWVDLAAYVEPPRRGSFGFGLGASSSPTARAVSDKLQDYLTEKRITPKQASLLVRECTKVLQGQGEFANWKAPNAACSLALPQWQRLIVHCRLLSGRSRNPRHIQTLETSRVSIHNRKDPRTLPEGCLSE